MDPVIRCTTLPSHSRSLKGFLFHFSWRSMNFYRLSHSELDNIEKVLPEQLSDTKVLTMKMEILLELTSNKLLNLKGVDLLSESKDTNLYTISLDDMLKTSLIYLLSKASKTKSWLWHHRSSHLNFGTLNKLAKDGLARGIPKLKFLKDHLCSACALEKRKKSSHQLKAEDTNQEKLYLYSGLIPNPIPQLPCNPPNRDDWDRLFQPMFDECFNPLPSSISPVLVVVAPRAVDIADSLVSMLIDQNSPSTSITSTQEQDHSPIISQGVEESPKTSPFHDDPLHESLYEDSTSQGSSSNA
ncbi:retrovirus-related pol polyprotein from transposon TNT 1-94 [Tanacetum coccineum]|uniref:Retrovirus-related pol polyprotein from transposon TNT 1-94 n=1 Tax=Tanacetum coccineum TaxID=301880 RepID=A0ABQ4Z978_9ASTR